MGHHRGWEGRLGSLYGVSEATGRSRNVTRPAQEGLLAQASTSPIEGQPLPMGWEGTHVCVGRRVRVHRALCIYT